MKFQQLGILDAYYGIRHIMASSSDIVDDALVNLCKNIRTTGDPFSQQENDDVDELIETFQKDLQSNDPAQDALV